MNWLITGGCGFIGTNLIKKLISENKNNIRIIDNLSGSSRNDLQHICEFHEGSSPSSGGFCSGVELIVADIQDEKVALAAAQNADILVHLAANTGVAPSVENPRQDCLANVIGTFNYLEAARLNGVRRFIFASSGAPVGEVEPPIHEELAAHPVSPYGASKLAGEGYCSAYFRTYGVETVALRFGNVYGPGSSHKSSVVAKFIRRALSGKPLEIYGDGTQTRDFIYIDDLIDVLLRSAYQEGVGGEVFQIATSRETTVSEIATRITEILQARGMGDIRVVHARPRLGDVKRNFSDTSKAREMLGWEPLYSLDEGLVLTLDFFLGEPGGHEVHLPLTPSLPTL